MLQLRDSITTWPTMSWAELTTTLPQIGGDRATLDRLSPAEHVVAVHIAEGLSNREIAAALGKSEATVKNQVSSCLRKLNVSTRMKLMALLR